MNRTYDETAHFFSDTGIYTGSASVGTQRKKRIQWTTLFASLLAFLSCAKVRTARKIGTVVFCLIGLVGIVGGIEAGRLSLPVGLLLGSALVGIEFLSLRRR